MVGEKIMKLKSSISDRVFDICNYALMFLLIVVTVQPFYYVLCASLSNAEGVAAANGFLLFPKGFNLEGYKAVFSNQMIFIGYKNTLFYVVVGTLLNIVFTTIFAYSLSRKGTFWGSKVMFLVTFTMFIGGGMIPRYILIQKLGMMGTPWAILLPDVIATWNLIVMRTSFQELPDSLEEAAKIDGASDWTIFSKIAVPLAMPTIAVMVLFYGVGRWNGWFNASIYLKQREMFPLQLILREILILNSMDDMSIGTTSDMKVSVEETIKYATIIVATLPILLAYPFLQKYFVKGVMVGAIKG